MVKKIVSLSVRQARENLERFTMNDNNLESIENAAGIMADSIAANGKVISCGNGGSLCDATHFAEELTGRFRRNRRPLPAIAVNDPAHITCVGNDYGFDDIFANYIEALGAPQDTLLAFSTSGNSENIIRAAVKAKQKGMKVVAMTRQGDNRLQKLADVTIAAPSAEFSDRVQEVHIMAVHIMIECIERLLDAEGNVK